MSHERVIKGSHVRRRGLPVRGQPGRRAARHVGRPPPARGRAWTWSGLAGTARGEGRTEAVPGRQVCRFALRPPASFTRREVAGLRGRDLGLRGRVARTWLPGARRGPARPGAPARGALSARPLVRHRWSPRRAGIPGGREGAADLCAQPLRGFLTWEGRYRRPGAGPASLPERPDKCAGHAHT